MNSGSTIDERTTRHAGCVLAKESGSVSMKCFIWLRKVRHRGLFKVDWVFTFACAAYNLVRLRNLSV